MTNLCMFNGCINYGSKVECVVFYCSFLLKSNMERSSLYYYLAAQLIEQENEERETGEISRRALQRKFQDSLDLSDIEFKNRFRFTKEAFLFLNNELCQKTNLKNSRRISVQTKILCALSFYATGSYQRLIGMAQSLGQTTVSKFISEVTDALVSPALMNSIIKFPVTRTERDFIKNKFYTEFGFPGVIGCIDGSHFHIQKPKKDLVHIYYCRKHFHSLNVQMICDSDCRILNVNTRFGGATHDAFIWEYSAAHDLMQELHRSNEQVWLLGDSGYPQRPWIMTPISDAAEGSPEVKYNSVHGKTRVTIENTFGRLKNRWRCLSKERTLHYTPEKCAKIIMACSVLHNLAINFNVPEPEQSNDSHRNYDPNSPSATVPHILENNSNGDALSMGRAIRNLLIERINRQHTN